MEWAERLNSVIDYVESNLASEIDTEEVMKRACCSGSHLQRMFNIACGITLGEYIRRRRLTVAAIELSSGNTRVRDVAGKYGYNSPEAFSRAFRQVHGITPRAACTQGVQLVSYSRISFHVSVEGGNDLNYKIVRKPAFDTVGKARRFTAVNGRNLIEIPKFWDELTLNKDLDILYELTGGKPGPVTGGDRLGVVFHVHTEEGFMYGIAMEKIGDTVPEGFEVIHVPESTWAIFDVVGITPYALRPVRRRIYGEWFASTGSKRDNNRYMEVYFPGADWIPGYHSQIWVQLKTKNHFRLPVAPSSLTACAFRGIVNGTWSMKIPVIASITFTMIISSDSCIQGSFKGTHSGTIQGQVDLNGNLNATGLVTEGAIAPAKIPIMGHLYRAGDNLSMQGYFSYNAQESFFSGTGKVSK